MKKLLPILLVAALCGCVSTTARKPATMPPMPPLPKGVKAPAFTKSTTKPVARVAAAAVVPVGYPAIFIGGWNVIPADPPFFPAQTNVFIMCDQPSNNVLSVRMNAALATAPVSAWPEPAQWGCYPQDQLLGMSISVPGTSYFKSILTPCPPVTEARAVADVATPTDKTMVVRGKTYKLVKLQRAGEDTRKVQRYRLVPR